MTRSPLPAWLSFLWGILFGGLNLYWTAGGDLLVDRLAIAIQEDVAAGDTALLVVNALGGVAKIALGLLALGTIARWGRRIPYRLHLALLYAAGVALLLYGGANWTQMLLVEFGRVDVPVSIGAAQVRWYLLLWEPIWIVGGALLLWTAEAYRRAR